MINYFQKKKILSDRKLFISNISHQKTIVISFQNNQGKYLWTDNFTSSQTTQDKGESYFEICNDSISLCLCNLYWKSYSGVCFSKTNQNTVRGWDPSEKQIATEWDVTEAKKVKKRKNRHSAGLAILQRSFRMHRIICLLPSERQYCSMIKARNRQPGYLELTTV